MNGIAAGGMESDYSDSDCDMVFTAPNSNDSSTRKLKIPEYVAVENTSPNLPNLVRPTTNSSKFVHDASLPRSRNNLKQSNSHQPKRKEEQCVMKNSVLLHDLRYAIIHGDLATVKDVISKGIWIDTILKGGWTSLMYASSAAHPDIVLYLLENKADPNYHKDMYTSLMAVCASSKEDEEQLLECCRHLIKYKARINVYERHLTTPLMFAAREGRIKLVTELVDSEANIFSQDNRGSTALHWAALGGHGVVVRYLLSKGADPKQLDRSGQTAADLARHNDHQEVSTVLERYSEKKELEFPIDQPKKILTKSQEELLKNNTSESSQKPQEKYVQQQGELELFLNGIGLGYLVSLFQDQHVAFTDLLLMNETNLEKMGVKQMGIRKKILEAAKATHKKDWKQTSLPNFSNYQYISCPDAVAMMANVSKHLKYIATSVTFIRTQIQTNPRILEIAQESASVHDLLDEMYDSMTNIQHLHDELKFFKLHLEKVQGKEDYICGGLIVETVPKSRHSIAKMFFIVAAVSVTVGGIMWKKPETFSHLVSTLQSHLQFSFLTRT